MTDDPRDVAPRDIPAEEAVLGAVLRAAQVDPSAAVATLEQVPDAEDFYWPYHQTLVMHLRAAADKGDPIEPGAVLGRLIDSGDIRQQHLDGPRLLDLVQRAAANGSVDYYVERIRATAKLRRAILAVGKASTRLNTVHDIEDVDSALYLAMADLEEEANPASLLRAPDTWHPIDVGTIVDDMLAGRYEAPAPTVGARTPDGQPLLYPGRAHAAYGESESGKSWLALALAAHELKAGHAVVYVDFEDEAGAVVGRLLAMQCPVDAIRDRFAYMRPDEPLELGTNRNVLAQALGDLRPTLGIVDGVTEAMALHGLELKDNTDIARFHRALPGRITAAGAASLVLDHVTKDKDSRGRYAVGGAHKLAGLSGAGFLINNRAPFGVGLVGRSNVYVTKDRPGQLRRHCTKRGHEQGMYWLGDLVLDPVDAGGEVVTVSIDGTAPMARTDPARPTIYMERVSKALERAGRPLSLREIIDRVSGKDEHIREGAAALEDYKYVEITSGPRGAKLHTLLRPFDPAEEEEPPDDEDHQESLPVGS